MSQPSDQSHILPQRPATNDLGAWSNYWNALNQPWRTEPEIDFERQNELTTFLAIMPDIKQGIYPLKGIKLSRADIEWLLATHKGGRGPVYRIDERQYDGRVLDLRGANLSEVDLSGLPLANMLGGLSLSEWRTATAEQRLAAIIYLGRANLSRANLEGAILVEAYLEKAKLEQARLEGAWLSKAYMQGANLIEANLEGTDLSEANLNEVLLTGASLKGANLLGTQLKNANLSLGQFEGADLTWVDLSGAELSQAHLKRSNLSGASLKGAELSKAYLEGADLREAHLEGADLREAHLEGADLREAHLEGADLQGAFFDITSNLRGTIFGDIKHGFVRLADVHWNNVNLAVVDWTSVKMLDDEEAIRRERLFGETPDQSRRVEEYRAAVRASRQLAIALQDQGLNEEADNFAFHAQLLQRAVLRRQRRLLKYVLSWFLYLLAGYGYRPMRSLLWYLFIVSGFAIVYYLFGHVALLEAFVFSLSSFHGRGFFQPVQSLGDPVAILASLEAVVGLIIEISFIATFTLRFFGK